MLLDIRGDQVKEVVKIISRSRLDKLPARDIFEKMDQSIHVVRRLVRSMTEEGYLERTQKSYSTMYYKLTDKGKSIIF